MKLKLKNRKVSLKVLVGTWIVILLAATGLYVLAQPSAPVWISGGPYPAAYDYTVFEDSGTYYTKTSTGYISAESTNFSYLLTTFMANGISIFFESGRYEVDIPNTLGSNVSLYAVPWTVCIYIEDTVTFPVSTGIFQGHALTNVVIQGLIIDGNKQSIPSGPFGYGRGLYFTNSSNILIKDCQIINAVFVGADIRGCQNVWISNSYFYENGKADNALTFGVGLYIRNSGSPGQDSTNVTVSDCIFNSNGDRTNGDGSGITAYGQGYILLSNVICNNNTRYGIKSQCGNLTVSGFQTNYNDFGVSVSTGFDANTTIISDGESIGNRIYGIYVTAPASIINCEVAYNTGDGIRAEAYQQFVGIIISNCHVHDNGQHGINIRGPDTTIISNCLSYRNAQNGIELGNYSTRHTTFSIVSACNTWSNGAYGFREAATSSCNNNVFIGCITEANTFDGFNLVGGSSRVFSSWNGTHWQNDSP